MVFPGAPARSDILDGPGTHFPNLKVVCSLKRSALEEKYLLPAEYRFVLPKADATVNKPPANCIAMYQATFSYGVRFLLHLVIVNILNKYDLAPVQIVPTSWQNICSFIATCELHGLTCTGRAFALVHSVQRASSEIEDLGWYCFNDKKGFMMTIEKKSNIKS